MPSAAKLHTGQHIGNQFAEAVRGDSAGYGGYNHRRRRVERGLLRHFGGGRRAPRSILREITRNVFDFDITKIRVENVAYRPYDVFRRFSGAIVFCTKRRTYGEFVTKRYPLLELDSLKYIDYHGARSEAMNRIGTPD
jgi:hypothetical protein